MDDITYSWIISVDTDSYRETIEFDKKIKTMLTMSEAIKVKKEMVDNYENLLKENNLLSK